MSGVERSIQTGLGPVNQALGTPASTQPATGSGVFNSTVGTSAVKVLSSAGDPTKVRRVKIVAPVAGTNLGWTTVITNAAAPTLTATGTGTATDGSLVEGGGGATEWINLAGNLDLYLAASAAATPYQLTVVEQ
jgi:hypothetical protein